MNINVAAMHSDLEQSVREQVMKDFRNGHIDVLVATDVVSRGIDINDISIVINYDIPNDPEDYVHRIGRTARGTDGRGLAITLVSEKEQGDFKDIETFLGKEIYKIPIDPSLGEAPSYEPENHKQNRKRFGKGLKGRRSGKENNKRPQKERGAFKRSNRKTNKNNKPGDSSGPNK